MGYSPPKSVKVNAFYCSSRKPEHPETAPSSISHSKGSSKMGVSYRDILRVVVTLAYMYFVINVIFPIVNAAPVDHPNIPISHENSTDSQDPADDRMLKPPRFPYGGPFGFYSSGLLCIFDGTPYIGGWFGRSCAGPIAPFMRPTPPSTVATTTTTTTTTEAPLAPGGFPYPFFNPQFGWMPPMNYGWGGNNYQEQNPDDDYGDPVEGNPWEPDDDEIFIETYGHSASKPGFKLGEPSP